MTSHSHQDRSFSSFKRARRKSVSAVSRVQGVVGVMNLRRDKENPMTVVQRGPMS